MLQNAYVFSPQNAKKPPKKPQIVKQNKPFPFTNDSTVPYTERHFLGASIKVLNKPPYSTKQPDAIPYDAAKNKSIRFNAESLTKAH